MSTSDDADKRSFAWLALCLRQALLAREETRKAIKINLKVSTIFRRSNAAS